MSSTPTSDLLELVAQTIDRQLYRHPTEMFPGSSERENRPFDYDRMARILAAFDAARFLEEHFRHAKNLIGKEALLRYACTQVRVAGDVLEFGVMEGRTFRILCESFPDSTVHGFDSFLGIPSDWRHDRPAGSFSTNGKAPADLPRNALLRVGMFSETIPDYRKENATNAALIHIDSDVYESAVDVLSGLSASIVEGTVIVFDEYLNYPGWREHEFKAFSEFVSERNVTFEYIAFASSYLSVAVRILGIDEPPAL